MLIDILTYSSVFVSTACFLLGLNIIYKNPKSLPHILLFIQNIILSLVVFHLILIHKAGTVETMIIFQKSGIALLAALFLAVFQFIVVLTRTKIHKILIAGAYAALLLIIITVALSGTATNIQKINGIWVFKETYFTLWFGLEFAFIQILAVSTFYILVKWRRRTTLIKERKQGRILLFYFLISFAIGYLDTIIPWFFLDYSTHIGVFFLAIYIFGMYYAFIKYRLLNFEWTDAIDEILSNISDMVIILDPEGKIIKANSKAMITFSEGEGDLISKKIDQILDAGSLKKRDIQRLFSGEISSAKETVNFNRKTRQFRTASYFSRVYDKFGDFMGVLLMLKENEDTGKFREKYRLTDKQMEIILLSISGASDDEICGKLSLKIRTIEDHFSAIFDKLHINDRSELFRLASEFHII